MGFGIVQKTMQIYEKSGNIYCFIQKKYENNLSQGLGNYFGNSKKIWA